jgi:4-amino-4-deoxy-L-arabinose transferase-like glycosyltransferase
VADSFSISYKEAVVYFDKHSLLSFLTNLSTSIFGRNNIALRLPFILFYIGSVILLYFLTSDYFKKQSDRLASIFIFMMLPGLNSAALLVNESRHPLSPIR